MSTPSIAAVSSISGALACTVTPGADTACRAAGDISAIAVTATRSEPASARRWVRPIRPAPTRPSRNGAMSQTPFGQERAVVPLFGGGPREPFGATGEDVLLDHQPAAERDLPQPAEHGVRVEIAVTQ